MSEASESDDDEMRGLRDKLAAAERRIKAATQYLRRMLEHSYELEEAAQRVTDALELAENETAAMRKRIAELEEALRAAQETIGAFTDGRNRAEARIVELEAALKRDADPN